MRGVVDDVQTSAIFIEFANHISLNTVEVVWGKPARPEWSQALEITPRTVHALHVTVRGRCSHASRLNADDPHLESMGPSWLHSLWLLIARPPRSLQKPAGHILR